jgi:hypothetical protein
VFQSKSNSKVILNLTGLEDRTNPAVGDPYIPPPPPPPVVVVIHVPIILPPSPVQGGQSNTISVI